MTPIQAKYKIIKNTPKDYIWWSNSPRANPCVIAKLRKKVCFTVSAVGTINASSSDRSPLVGSSLLLELPLIFWSRLIWSTHLIQVPVTGKIICKDYIIRCHLLHCIVWIIIEQFYTYIVGYFFAQQPIREHFLKPLR